MVDITCHTHVTPVRLTLISPVAYRTIVNRTVYIPFADESANPSMKYFCIFSAQRWLFAHISLHCVHFYYGQMYRYSRRHYLSRAYRFFSSLFKYMKNRFFYQLCRPILFWLFFLFGTFRFQVFLHFLTHSILF